jgi:hypothetical protein
LHRRGQKSKARRGFRYNRLGGWMHRLRSTLPLVYAVCVGVIRVLLEKLSRRARGKASDECASAWRVRHKELFTLLHGKRERSSEPWWIKLESNARGCIIHAICFIHTQKARKIRRLSLSLVHFSATLGPLSRSLYLERPRINVSTHLVFCLLSPSIQQKIEYMCVCLLS